VQSVISYIISLKQCVQIMVYTILFTKLPAGVAILPNEGIYVFITYQEMPFLIEYMYMLYAE